MSAPHAGFPAAPRRHAGDRRACRFRLRGRSGVGFRVGERTRLGTCRSSFPKRFHTSVRANASQSRWREISMPCSESCTFRRLRKKRRSPARCRACDDPATLHRQEAPCRRNDENRKHPIVSGAQWWAPILPTRNGHRARIRGIAIKSTAPRCVSIGPAEPGAPHRASPPALPTHPPRPRRRSDTLRTLNGPSCSAPANLRRQRPPASPAYAGPAAPTRRKFHGFPRFSCNPSQSAAPPGAVDLPEHSAKVPEPNGSVLRFRYDAIPRMRLTGAGPTQFPPPPARLRTTT